MKVLNILLLAGTVVTNLAPAYASLRNYVELQRVVEEDEPTLALEPNIEHDSDEPSNRMLGRRGNGNNNKFKKNGGNNMNKKKFKNLVKKKKKFGNGVKLPWKNNHSSSGASTSSKDDTSSPSAAPTPNITPTVGTNKTLAPTTPVAAFETPAPNPGDLYDTIEKCEQNDGCSISGESCATDFTGIYCLCENVFSAGSAKEGECCNRDENCESNECIGQGVSPGPDVSRGICGSGVPEDNWLSNLPEKGVCGTEAGSDTSFGCGQFYTDERFGYYLTCFDNLQEFKSLTSIRFWTDSEYGVGDGVGATVSFYYAYRPVDGAPLEPYYIFTNPLDPNRIPYYPPPQDRYAFAIREVPSAEETGGTTYKSGLNSFTFDDPVDISPNSNPIDAFCVGLTPPLRSEDLCGRFGYCSDPGLSVQTFGPSENSNVKCSTRLAPDGTNPGNPDFNFFPNEDADIPGFCIEVEGSTNKSLTCPSPAPTNIPLQKIGSYPSPTLTNQTNPTIDPVTTANDCFYMHWDEESPRIGKRIIDYDTYFMQLMAANGYITVSVDYDDIGRSYVVNGCNEPLGFKAKSRAIFDINSPNSVANQVCNSDDTIPVDCAMGIATAGFSQGAHISIMARNYNPQVTGNLALGNGNDNRGVDVSCVNSDQLELQKERRRSIVGELDQFFGGNYNGVLNQQLDISGYRSTNRCPLQCFDSTTDCNCFYQRGASPFAPDDPQQTNGFYIIKGKRHNFFNGEFFDIETVWGAPQNFHWLAQVARN